MDRRKDPGAGTPLARVRAGATGDPPPAAPADDSELALVGALLAMGLVPVLGELLRPGRWSPAIVGFAAAAALLAGRELWSQLGARRAR